MTNNNLNNLTDRQKSNDFDSLEPVREVKKSKCLRPFPYKYVYKNIQDVADLGESLSVFAEIIKLDIHPAHKIAMSRLLASRDFGNKTLFDMELGNRIRRWIRRWDTHVAAAQFMKERGPFNFGLTIRFQRNYSSIQCQRLVKTYFRHFQKLLGPATPINGFGVAEPDTLPIYKDASFHIHCGLGIRSSKTAQQLREIATTAAAMTLDANGRPAIRVPHVTKSGSYSRAMELHFVEIYDEIGWCLYCTKKSEGDPDFLSGHGFLIERGKVSFLNEMI